MPKPASLISACIFTCEKVLQEKDDVFSAIRIADIHYASTAIPPGIEPEDVGLEIKGVFLAKFSAPDGSQFHIGISHIQPDGAIRRLKDIPATLTSKVDLPSYVPRGVSLELRLMLPATNGVHYLTADIDGEEVARYPFTVLIEQSEHARD